MTSAVKKANQGNGLESKEHGGVALLQWDASGRPPSGGDSPMISGWSGGFGHEMIPAGGSNGLPWTTEHEGEKSNKKAICLQAGCTGQRRAELEIHSKETSLRGMKAGCQPLPYCLAALGPCLLRLSPSPSHFWIVFIGLVRWLRT